MVEEMIDIAVPIYAWTCSCECRFGIILLSSPLGWHHWGNGKMPPHCPKCGKKVDDKN